MTSSGEPTVPGDDRSSGDDGVGAMTPGATAAGSPTAGTPARPGTPAENGTAAVPGIVAAAEPVPCAAAQGGEERPGNSLLKASWIGTALFVLTAGLAAAVPAADIPALVVALVLFAAGTVALAAALLRAAARSRHEELTMSGLFFLEQAPKAVRRQHFGSLAIEVVVAFVTAALRPNSSLAFGILAPVWAEGLAALWAARHGAFPPRRIPSRQGTASGTGALGTTGAAPAADPPADPPPC